jgi:hypothetical protein
MRDGAYEYLSSTRTVPDGGLPLVYERGAGASMLQVAYDPALGWRDADQPPLRDSDSW